MATNGTQISDMTDSVLLPDGGFVPFVVEDNSVSGFVPSENYRYNLGADLLGRASYAALAANDGALLVGYGDTTVGEALSEIEDDLANVTVGLAAEVAARVAADAGFDVRIDNLESTVISGIRVYQSWVDISTAFLAYSGATAYVVDDTVLNQGAFWVNVQAGTGNAPPTLPTESNAYWRLITATPGGIAAQVSADDLGTHTDPVVGGTVDNAGIYRWSSATPGWERIGDLDSQVASVYADAAEAAAAVLGGAATLGDIPTKPSDDSGEVEWISRTQFGQQPKLAVPLDVAAEYQLHGTFTDPGTRFSTTVIGDELQISSNLNNFFPVGPVAPTQVRSGFVYVVRGRITADPNGNTGVMVAFEPVAPTPGGAVVNFSAGSCLLIVRGNGTFGVYDYTSNVIFPGSTSSYGSVSTFTTEEVEIIVEMTSATTATIYISIGGQPQIPRTVTGLPANAYFGTGIRIGSASTVGRLSEMVAYGASLDVTKRVYIDPNSGPGGDGSRNDPYETIAEAVADINRDTMRRSLEVTFQDGISYGSLTIDASRWDEVTIQGSVGANPIVKASVEIVTSWTQIGASGVWYTDKPPYRDGNDTYGHVIDVTPGHIHAFGRTGSYVVDGLFPYGRLPEDTPFNSPSFVAGTCSVHTTGTYAGKVLVKMMNGYSPNASDLEFSVHDFAISVASRIDDAWNACRVTINNIEAFGSYINAVDMRRVQFSLSNVTAQASQFFGFEMEHSSGQAYGCRARCTVADGYHWTGLTPAPEAPLRSQFFDCWAMAQGYFPGLILGDGWSNHDPESHQIALFGCGSIAAGKDGLASPGGATLENFTARDAWLAGVELYGEAEFASTALSMSGGIIATCEYGVYCHTDALTSTVRTVFADGVRFDTNGTNSMYAVSNGAASGAIINATDCGYLGATPADGQKGVDGSGAAINVRTSTPAT